MEELPKGRTVFRGLGGMMLPEAFHQPDEFGCRGGVEFAFLSTTTKREVAVQYSGTGAGLPTIFEIAVGQVDRGASLKVLSQYAGEEEILMPPLSNLEVVGDAWMDEGCMVVPLRINVNLKSATIDELVERRKLLHMDMLHNLTSEAALALENHALSANLLHGSLLHALVVAAGQRLMDEYRSKGSEHGARDPEEFNEDAKYKLLINEAVDYKRQVIVLALVTGWYSGEATDHFWIPVSGTVDPHVDCIPRPYPSRRHRPELRVCKSCHGSPATASSGP